MNSRQFIMKALKRYPSHPLCYENRFQVSVKVQHFCQGYHLPTVFPQMRPLSALTTNPVRQFHALRSGQNEMVCGQTKAFSPMVKGSFEPAHFLANRSGKIQMEHFTTSNVLQDSKNSLGSGPGTWQESKHWRKKLFEVLTFGSLLGLSLSGSNTNDELTKDEDEDNVCLSTCASETYINEAAIAGVHRCARKSALVTETSNIFGDFEDELTFDKLIIDSGNSEPCDMASDCLEPEVLSYSKPVLEDETPCRATDNICKTQDRWEGKKKLGQKPGVIRTRNQGSESHLEAEAFSKFVEDELTLDELIIDSGNTEPCDMTLKCLEPEAPIIPETEPVLEDKKPSRATDNISKTQDRWVSKKKPCKKPGVCRTRSRGPESDLETETQPGLGKEEGDVPPNKGREIAGAYKGINGTKRPCEDVDEYDYIIL